MHVIRFYTGCHGAHFMLVPAPAQTMIGNYIVALQLHSLVEIKYKIKRKANHTILSEAISTNFITFEN